MLHEGKKISDKRYYELLELPEDATGEDIKQHYKFMASKLHPDKKSGSEEAFKELQEAYAVLSNPERRRMYDLTGDGKGLTEFALQKEAQTAVSQAFGEIVEAKFNAITETDIITQIENAIHRAMGDIEGELEKSEKKAEKLDDVKERLTNSAGDVILFNQLDIMVSGYKKKQAGHLRALVISQMALEILKDYEFETDEDIEDEEDAVIYTETETGTGQW